MLRFSLLPDLPTKKHQSVKKKKKNPVSDEDSGVNFQHGAWGLQASLVAQLVKNPPAMRETWV